MSADKANPGGVISVLLRLRGEECQSVSVLAGSNGESDFKMWPGRWPYSHLLMWGLLLAGGSGSQWRFFAFAIVDPQLCVLYVQIVKFAVTDLFFCRFLLAFCN